MIGGNWMVDLAYHENGMTYSPGVLRGIADLLEAVGGTSDDGDVTLTTMNPQTGQHDASFFELVRSGEVVGCYNFPLTWVMRIIPSP